MVCVCFVDLCSGDSGDADGGGFFSTRSVEETHFSLSFVVVPCLWDRLVATLFLGLNSGSHCCRLLQRIHEI